MLRTFNIFVDTPCCILTQEESKRLIHGSAKEKYEFFLKATGLRLIHDELTANEAKINDAMELRESCRPNVERAKLYKNQCAKQLQDFTQLDHMQAAIRVESAKLHWDEVRLAEGLVQGLQEELGEKQEALDQASEALKASALPELERKLVDLTADMDRLLAQRGPVEEQYEAAKEQLRKAVQVHTHRSNNVKGLLTTKKDRESQLKTVSNEVSLYWDGTRIGLIWITLILLAHLVGVLI